MDKYIYLYDINNCVLCLTEFKDEPANVYLSCKHKYHNKCLKNGYLIKIYVPYVINEN